MKKLAFILLVFLAFGITVNGQENPITELDLYGCWILERNKDELPKIKKRIYQHCEGSNPKLKLGVSVISLKAFNKCDYKYYRSFTCGNEMPPEYGWAFDESTGIIEIYHGKEWLSEFKNEDPEKFIELGLPEKFDELKLKVVELADGSIGLEKLRTTIPPMKSLSPVL